MIKSLINKYQTFIKYIISAGISYAIDLFAFTIFCFVFKTQEAYILIATILARVISSFINFLINKNKVFSSENKKKSDINVLLSYYFLVVIQMLNSGITVAIIYKLLGNNLTIIKFLVDVAILGMNYFIQKRYIFNNRHIEFTKILLNIRDFLKNNKGICVIMLISLVLHIIVLADLGIMYNLESDDLSYIESGIHFKNNLELIMHGVKSAQIMPGMTYFIALVSYVFGEGKALFAALKIVWMILGIASILGVYKIVRLYSNKVFSCIAAAFLLSIDFIWMDNTILTETPFMFGFIYLIYSSLQLARTKENKYFYQIIIFYMICILLKANIAPYPLFLIIYLIIKKYDLNKLLKQMLIAAGVLLVFFIPWTVRNYIAFDKFIPLTYGTGNPLLLGTYQGSGYPEDNQEEYDKYVEENASDEMKKYISGEETSKPYKQRYYLLEKDGLIAKYRMKKWWDTDKASMLKSYLIFKPLGLIYNTFYWKGLFNITIGMILKLRMIDIVLTIVCGVVLLFNKKTVFECLFLAFNYIFQILVYSYTFSFSRYGQTLIFIRFIIIGMGLQVIYEKIKDKRRKRLNVNT